MILTEASANAVIARLKEKVEANLNLQYRDSVQVRFADLVSVTPQWSGNLAANWQISLDGSATYTEELKQTEWQKGPWAQVGDPRAVAIAVAAALKVPFTYHDVVYFANATPLEFTDYHVIGEDDVTRRVRIVNLINGKVAMVSYIKSKYGSMR